MRRLTCLFAAFSGVALAQPVALQLGNSALVEPSRFARTAAEFHPNLEALRAGSMELLVTLPESRQVVLERTSFEDRGEGDVLWRGRVVLAPESFALLTVKGGIVTGTIQTPTDAYEIHMRAGLAVFEQMERVRPERIEPTILAPNPVLTPNSKEAVGSRLAEAIPAGGESEIDVMVVYTANAMSNVGGEPAMVATIQGMIDYANMVFLNSNVPAHYRLVHSYRTANATYRDVDAGASNLERMRLDPELNSLRNTYGADLVTLMVPSGGGSFCGVAVSNNVFNVPNVQIFYQMTTLDPACGGVGVSFAHENGHLLGLGHNPEYSASVGEPTPAIPYAQGNQSGTFATTMSNSGCPLCHIPYFSSPEISYQGVPIGIADQRDNARAARTNAPLIAAFRASGPPPPANPPSAPTGLNAVPQVGSNGALQVSLGWFPTPTASSYDIERSADGTTFFPLTTVSVSNFTDTNVVTPGTYYYRLRARNMKGLSPYGDVRQAVMPVPPGAPSGLTATAQGSQEILLRWTDGSTNEIGFAIEVLLNGNFEAFDGTGPNATQYVFRFGQPSTAYTFRVRAYTDMLLSGPSNEVSATTLAANPGTVTGFAFNDPNNSGKPDVGETPAANLVIYYDANANGVLDDAGPQVTVSGEFKVQPGTNLPYLSAPNYTLRNLPAGSRRICAAFSPTVPGKSFCRTVNILNGATTTGVHFRVVSGRVVQ